MLINSIILALSSSIDSLGIGITYGLKNTRISGFAKIVLFTISFLISIVSVWCGDVIKNIFSDFVTKLIGNSILILMGIFVCFQALRKDDLSEAETAPSELITDYEEKIYSFFIDFLGITIKIIKNPTSSDLDDSNSIDAKEALFLGFALSLDCFCIGACGSVLGLNSFLFPLFISIFQLAFLSLGNILGKKLHHLNNLPNNIWSVISGTLLILIGMIRFIFT
ncbi:MAG: sporulation membrane protein YtaF [Clostridia bacterium]|nr:sporulation membrane protein YtaF [Clostridia bacterium]